MKAILSTVIIMTLGFAAALDAQLRRGVSEQERASVVEKVNALFGAGKYDPYSIDVMNVDSAVDPNAPLGVEDPHHLLEHCYVFLAVGKMQSDGSYPGGFVGVYKDGSIVWHSPAIINSEIVANAEINTILDLNKDGKPDIVTDWEEGMHGEADYLWIFSWDGHQGTPLNLWDSTGHSNLVSYTDEDHFVDMKGDGVLEIQGKWQTEDIPASDISVLYAWNGENYVSIDTSSFASVGAPPRNEVNATVHAGVKRLNDSLYFSYVVENKKSSLQKIENFMLMAEKDSIANSAGKYGWDFVKDYVNPRIVWMDMTGLYLLSPGERDTFIIETRVDLPGINSFYMQGNNGNSDLSDIYTNSFHGLTISPASPPAHFVPLAFLDTLVSYKHQCVTLGWLTNGPAQGKDEDDDKADEGIVERLDRRLDKAKTALAENDSVKARLELELFVKEVEQLYHKNKEEGKRRGVPSLTSEGYALLKYNAEYLIEKLPERHGRGDEGEHRGKK